VQRLTANGSSPEPSEPGRCAVIFAAEALDPEPGAAGQIKTGRTWQSLGQLTNTPSERLSELQAEAVAEANAVLDQEG
jgi:hypothetical protein